MRHCIPGKVSHGSDNEVSRDEVPLERKTLSGEISGERELGFIGRK
jgi:hypothetical protein